MLTSFRWPASGWPIGDLLSRCKLGQIYLGIHPHPTFFCQNRSLSVEHAIPSVAFVIQSQGRHSRISNHLPIPQWEPQAKGCHRESSSCRRLLIRPSLIAPIYVMSGRFLMWKSRQKSFPIEFHDIN
jgi:hypothetical protein